MKVLSGKLNSKETTIGIILFMCYILLFVKRQNGSEAAGWGADLENQDQNDARTATLSPKLVKSLADIIN